MADDKAAESGVRGGGGEEVAMNAAAEVAKDASRECEAKGGSGQAPATEVPSETHPEAKPEAEDKSDKASAPEGGKPAGAVAGGGEAKPKVSNKYSCTKYCHSFSERGRGGRQLSPSTTVGLAPSRRLLFRTGTNFLISLLQITTGVMLRSSEWVWLGTFLYRRPITRPLVGAH
jgi:hypothetical protein